MQLDTLPRLPNGKINRFDLPDFDKTRPDLSTPYVAPRVLAEKEMVSLWERILHVSPIGLNDRFFDLGGDSLAALSLISSIEERYGITLPVSSVITSDTVSRLITILHHRENSVLIPMVSNGTKPPLFCIHSGAGNVLCYQALSRRMGTDRPIFAIQWLGLDGNYPLHWRVESMARDYIKHIIKIQPHGPIHLMGYSFGGLVAFEMAHQLYQQGKTVSEVVLIDTKMNPDNRPEVGMRPGRRLRFRKRLERLGHRMQSPRQTFFRVTSLVLSAVTKPSLRRRILKKLLMRLRLNPGAPLPANERIDFYLSLAFAATGAYVPRICPSPVVLFESKYQPQKDLWRSVSGGGFEYHALNCDHFKLFEDPYMETIVNALTSFLDGKATSQLTAEAAV
jgi:thioesterase domain-containing protein/acyl carrier protein